MVDGMTKEFFQLLSRLDYLFFLFFGREGVEFWMADGVGADGAERVDVQCFKGFCIDAQLFITIPSYGDAIVDEPSCDIDGEGNFHLF